MDGSKHDGVFRVMSFGISSSAMPTARRAAILAIGKPVAFDASAELRGGDRDRVAGVYAHGVEIFDRADDHEVVAIIAHHFELIFLPTEDGLFDQGFVNRTGVKRV